MCKIAVPKPSYTLSNNDEKSEAIAPLRISHITNGYMICSFTRKKPIHLTTYRGGRIFD